MIIGDAKKHAAGILMSIKPKSGEMAEEPKDDMKSDIDPGLHACAEDIIDAFIKRDAMALASALKDFMDMADNDAPASDEPAPHIANPMDSMGS